MQISVDNTTTNLLTSAGSTSFGHDANGNLTTVNGATVYSYTPENMLETGGGASYRYDGDAMRTGKTVGSDKRYYIHGPGGQILSEMTSATCRVSDSIYAGGRLVATLGPAEPTLSLQATGVEVSESQGTAAMQVILTTADGCPTTREVTGSYATADGTYLDQTAAPFNAQLWNRYAYGLNNPLRNVDPDGRDSVDLVIGFGQGVGRVAAGAAMAFGAAIDSHGISNPGAAARVRTGPITEERQRRVHSVERGAGRP